MEPERRPGTSGSKSGRRKSYIDPKRNSDGNSGKGRLNKFSLIPKLKTEKSETKDLNRCQKDSPTVAKLYAAQNEEYDTKLRFLEEKEKSLAEYFSRIEDMLKILVEKKDKQKDKDVKVHRVRSPLCRKMTSEPSVFNQKRTDDGFFTYLEKDVQQISNIWLKTSSELIKTLKTLKNNPSLDRIQLEMESDKIQLAITQAKSLTLVKTKSVLEEAKKLLNHREMIRTELENLISAENLRKNQETVKKESEVEEERSKSGGTGDTVEEISTNKEVDKQNSTTDETSNNSLVSDISSPSGVTSSGEDEKSCDAELSKKNEIIAQLHKRIFELQKTCNDHCIKYNQLEMKMAEFHEKIQWDQVLWKQIGRLKELIKGLQQNNRQLESQKKELEEKISQLGMELERLSNLNHILNQKKLIKSQDSERKDDANETAEESYLSCSTREKILAEKQNLICQLNTIMHLMKEQESAAQKQIAAFQTKIDELTQNCNT